MNASEARKLQSSTIDSMLMASFMQNIYNKIKEAASKGDNYVDIMYPDSDKIRIAMLDELKKKGYDIHQTIDRIYIKW